MLEGGIQTKIQKYLEKKGYICINMIKTNKNGIPDLQILIGEGKHFWIEVKQKTGKLSKIQEFRIKKLRKAGDIVLIPYGFEDFINKYNELGKID